MRYFKPFGIAITLGAVACLGLNPAQAAGPKTNEQKNQEILAYAEAHPDDLTGLDRLAFKYTGEHIIASTNGISGQMDAATAQEVFRTKNAAVAASACTGGIPNFSVTIEVIPLVGPPAQKRVTGRWNFPDCFAGQAAPVDLASVEFSMPDCMRMINHNVSTFSVSGKSTYRGSLRTANVAGKAPIWNIADYTTNFEMQADHGGTGVTIQDYCAGTTTIGTAFDYEANIGGGVVSVTAGFGGLGVSYSGSPQAKQLGTVPVYFSL